MYLNSKHQNPSRVLGTKQIQNILIGYFSYSIDYRSIYPFNYRNQFIVEFGFGGFAADPFGFVFELPDRFNGQSRSFNLINQVLSQGINGNAPFGDDHVNQFTRSAKGGHLVPDHRDTVPEKWDGKYSAF